MSMLSGMEFWLFVLLQLVVISLFILIIRWLGAWMLRITDVLKNQKEIIDELRKLNAKK